MSTTGTDGYDTLQRILRDLADEANLTKGEFLAAIVRAGFEFTQGITDLIIAWAFPSIVGAAVKRAKTSNGFADRQLLFEHFNALSMSMELEQAAEKARRGAGPKNAGATEADFSVLLRNDPAIAGRAT